MKIAIVAANGRVGKLVAEEAVKRGHDVTAVVREANKTAAPKSLVKDALALAPADLAGFDAVVDAVGGWTADTVGAIPAAAADELARFVTGRPDAAYAALSAAEKTKVHVVMSLLTQESGTAVFTAPALSLDPNGTTTTFSYGGGTQTRTFHLDRDAQGGITIRFENTVRPTHLLVDLDAHPLGAGSELKGGYTLTFSAQ
jgi:putative NADH-flavin reductase